MNKYEIIGIVGEGAYGVVYKAKCKETGQFVAVKKFKESDEDEIARKTIMREVRMLRLLNHQNIVKLFEAFKRKGRLYLVFEYIEKNLLEVLEENICGIDPKRLRLYVYQMIKGVCFCHRSNVVHRDIKPENLLINPADSSLKICDFGFSRPLPQNFKGPRLEGGKMTDYVATRWYRSPELLLGYTDYGPEVDMWAIGCIMGELSDGQPLFPGDSEMDMLYLFQKILGPLTKEQQESFNKNPRFVGLKFPEITKPETLEKKYMTSLSKKALQLMCGLLKMDPADRLTSEQALMHVYFDDIREPEVEQELKALVTPVTRPIYSSQSRITSYGQKFGTGLNSLYNQNQLIQMTASGQSHQRSTNSTSKEKSINGGSSQATTGPLKPSQSYMSNNTNAAQSTTAPSSKNNQIHQQQQFTQQQQMNLTNCTDFGVSMSKRIGGGPMTSSHASSEKGQDSRTLQASKTYGQQQKAQFNNKKSYQNKSNQNQMMAQQQVQISKPSGTSHMNQREKKLFEIYSSQGGSKNNGGNQFNQNNQQFGQSNSGSMNMFIQSKNQSMTCYNLTGTNNNQNGSSYEYAIDGSQQNNNYFNNPSQQAYPQVSNTAKFTVANKGKSPNYQQIQLQNQRISYGGPNSELTSYQSEKRLKEYNHKNKLAHSRQQFIIEEEPTYSQRSSSDDTKKPRKNQTPNSKLVIIQNKKNAHGNNNSNSVGLKQNNHDQNNNVTLSRNATRTDVSMSQPEGAPYISQQRTNSQSNPQHNMQPNSVQQQQQLTSTNFNGDTGHDYNSRQATNDNSQQAQFIQQQQQHTRRTTGDTNSTVGGNMNSRSRGPANKQHQKYVSVMNQQQPAPSSQQQHNVNVHVYRDSSQGATSNQSSMGSVPNQSKTASKFINASRMLNANSYHPNPNQNAINPTNGASQSSQRGINDLLVESQKMIYAPTKDNRGSQKQSVLQQSYQSQAAQVSVINMNNRKKRQQMN